MESRKLALALVAILCALALPLYPAGSGAAKTPVPTAHRALHVSMRPVQKRATHKGVVHARVLRIMPLGDSITAGVLPGGGPIGDGGYRARLAQLFAAHGQQVAFVGSRTDFWTGRDALAHEGWPGYVIRSYPSSPAGELYGPLVSSALRSYQPDVVLLMIGTNDLLRLQNGGDDYTQQNIYQNMDALLREIFSVQPEVRVVVAPIVSSPRISQCEIDQFDTGRSSCSPPLTGGLPTLVWKYQRLGYRISLAENMRNAVPRDLKDFPDGLHPTTKGYDSMAAIWYGAVEAALR